MLNEDNASRNLFDDKKYYIHKHNNDKSVILIDKNYPYKQGGLSRFKPFLMSYCRLYMSETIIKNKIWDNVIRICIDGLILDKEHEFLKNRYNPIPEEKSSGNIFFVNSNNYYHQCIKCNEFFKYKNYKNCPNCN